MVYGYHVVMRFKTRPSIGFSLVVAEIWKGGGDIVVVSINCILAFCNKELLRLGLGSVRPLL